jgi:hypothetical protein
LHAPDEQQQAELELCDVISYVLTIYTLLSFSKNSTSVGTALSWYLHLASKKDPHQARKSSGDHQAKGRKEGKT